MPKENHNKDDHNKADKKTDIKPPKGPESLQEESPTFTLRSAFSVSSTQPGYLGI